MLWIIHSHFEMLNKVIYQTFVVSDEGDFRNAPQKTFKLNCQYLALSFDQ